MEEHNFHLSVKYGLTPELYELEWRATITLTDFNDEERFIESCRAFHKHVQRLKDEEINGYAGNSNKGGG